MICVAGWAGRQPFGPGLLLRPRFVTTTAVAGISHQTSLDARPPLPRAPDTAALWLARQACACRWKSTPWRAGHPCRIPFYFEAFREEGWSRWPWTGYRLRSCRAALGSPLRGRIALATEVLFDSEAKIDCPTEERRLAYLPQDFGLFPFMSVRGNEEFAMVCQSEASTRSQRRRAAMVCLDRFGIAHLASRLPNQLSGGERQRVALARVIASQPRALLLDEPTAFLDVEARADVRLLLAATLRELAIPALIVTHDFGDIRAIAGRVAVMDRGRMIACTSLAEALQAPPNPFAARLLRQSEPAGTTDVVLPLPDTRNAKN